MGDNLGIKRSTKQPIDNPAAEPEDNRDRFMEELEGFFGRKWDHKTGFTTPPSSPKKRRPRGVKAAVKTDGARKLEQSPTELTIESTRCITTQFAHPLDFGWLPPKDGSKPCHWCQDFTYGLLGLGRIRVEVIKLVDFEGFVELEGGHVERGYEPSRMCLTCARERLRIIRCKGHNMTPLGGITEEKFDFDAAYDSLSGSNRQATYTWCSLCLTPAFYGCRSSFVAASNGVTTARKGCGLLLCGRCAKLLAKCERSIPKTVAGIECVYGVSEMRADASFLIPGSELHRSYDGNVPIVID
jgi:hypothetical protein